MWTMRNWLKGVVYHKEAKISLEVLASKEVYSFEDIIRYPDESG